MMASLSGAHLLPLLPSTLYNAHIILYVILYNRMLYHIVVYKERGREDCTILQYAVLYYVLYAYSATNGK
jgi:hypothetical protein